MNRLTLVVLSLCLAFVNSDAARQRVKTYNIAAYGAIADGKTNNAAAIQHAIDAATARKGGGCVTIGAGRWLTGMIELKSNVTLHLEEGAILLGSTDPYDYDHLALTPQTLQTHQTLQTSQTPTPIIGKRGDEDVHQGLIVSNNATNIGITGKGIIDAQGLALALAIDSLHHIGERIDKNYNVRRQRPSTRPKLLFLAETENIRIQGVEFRNSAGWGLSFHGSNGITIDSVTVYNRGYWNNDGIDLNDCQDVTVRHCDINSADDGICLKSDDADSSCRNITIEDCRIASSASAVKFGTASYGGFRDITIRRINVYDTFRSAIALETVDGGVLENVLVDSVHAVNTGNPFFIRLGARHGYDADRKDVIKGGECKGICRNIVIRNMKAQVPFSRPDDAYDLRGPEVSYFHNPWPSSIAGVPGHEIENVTLENIEIEYPGRATKGMAYIGLYRAHEVPEVVDGYPEFSMFGELPSWAFYMRHVRNVRMSNVRVSHKDEDFRPAMVLEDVNGLKTEEINIKQEDIYIVRQ